MENDLALVIGASGSGIRTTIAILEDLFGYASITKVDPTALVSLVRTLPTLEHTRGRSTAVHVAMRRMTSLDLLRQQDQFIDDCMKAITALRAEHPVFKIIFLYCSQAALARRQDYGFHPLKSACGSISAAIFKECEIIVRLFMKLCSEFGDRIVFVDTTAPKPVGINDVKTTLDRALKRGSAEASSEGEGHRALCDELTTLGWNKMQTTVDQIQKTVELMRAESKTARKSPQISLNCLLQGENGTGKERIAEVVCTRSMRGDHKKPVVVDCTAIPEGLIESELFGSQRGAFTGAVHKLGLVAQAEGGAIFLDEVGLVNKSFQAKLLRFIETRDYRKVGGSKPESPVDCRIIAATSRNLEDAVKKGEFLPDLYYRLSGFTIHVPPLRERREDIPALLARYAPTKQFSYGAMAILFDYDWPGNVRELRHVGEVCSLVRPDEIQVSTLPIEITTRYRGLTEFAEHIKDRGQDPETTGFAAEDKIVSDWLKRLIQERNRELIKDLERKALREVVAETLDRNQWNITKTAEDLRMPRQQLYRYINEMEIRRPISS